VNLTQLAADSVVLCEIARNDGHWAAFNFKVIQGHRFWYQLKARMRLLTVNNTNLYSISLRFTVIAA